MSAKSKWKKCPHCDTSVLRGDLQHEVDCKKEQERKKKVRKQIKDITTGASEEAFDKAKPW